MKHTLGQRAVSFFVAACLIIAPVFASADEINPTTSESESFLDTNIVTALLTENEPEEEILETEEITSEPATEEVTDISTESTEELALTEEQKEAALEGEVVVLDTALQAEMDNIDLSSYTNLLDELNLFVFTESMDLSHIADAPDNAISGNAVSESEVLNYIETETQKANEALALEQAGEIDTTVIEEASSVEYEWIDTSEGTSMFALSRDASPADKAFYPFRSFLAKYVIENSDLTDDNIPRQWFRLYDEITTYSGKWTDKYYYSYTAATGEESTTQGKDIFFNTEFDEYLANSVIANPTFLAKIIERNVEIYDTYMDGHKTYTDWTSGMIELTSDSSYIGYSMTDPANALRAVDEDIQMVVLLASNWDSINQLQKDWVLSYMQFLITDYYQHHDDGNAIVNKNTMPELYDLMARSEWAVNGIPTDNGVNDKTYRQEFFKYVVSTGTGVGEWLNQVEGNPLSDEDKLTLDNCETIESVLEQTIILKQLVELPDVLDILKDYLERKYVWSQIDDTTSFKCVATLYDKSLTYYYANEVVECNTYTTAGDKRTYTATFNHIAFTPQSYVALGTKTPIGYVFPGESYTVNYAANFTYGALAVMTNGYRAEVVAVPYYNEGYEQAYRNNGHSWDYTAAPYEDDPLFDGSWRVYCVERYYTYNIGGLLVQNGRSTTYANGNVYYGNGLGGYFTNWTSGWVRDGYYTGAFTGGPSRE